MSRKLNILFLLLLFQAVLFPSMAVSATVEGTGVVEGYLTVSYSNSVGHIFVLSGSGQTVIYDAHGHSGNGYYSWNVFYLPVTLLVM
jgi:hypothetical protein